MPTSFSPEEVQEVLAARHRESEEAKRERVREFSRERDDAERLESRRLSKERGAVELSQAALGDNRAATVLAFIAFVFPILALPALVLARRAINETSGRIGGTAQATAVAALIGWFLMAGIAIALYV